MAEFCQHVESRHPTSITVTDNLVQVELSEPQHILKIAGITLKKYIYLYLYIGLHMFIYLFLEDITCINYISMKSAMSGRLKDDFII